MLRGYYDDSADEKKKVFAVGGFIADSDAWAVLFNPAWRSFLLGHGLDYFRTSECVNRSRAPYNCWDTAYGIAQLAELITIIRRTVVAAVSFSVRMDDFLAYKPRLDGILDVKVVPFHLCAAVAVNEVRKWQEKRPGQPAIQHIFESGTEGSGDLQRTLSSLTAKWPNVFIVPEGGSFQDKREALPLQAADLLAYETMRAELKKPVKAWEEYRMSARKLLEAPLERIEGTVEATFLARMIVEYNEKHGTNV